MKGNDVEISIIEISRPSELIVDERRFPHRQTVLDRFAYGYDYVIAGEDFLIRDL